MKSRRTRSVLVVLASLVLIATACGGSEDNAKGSDSGGKGSGAADKTEKTVDSGSDNSGDATTDTLSNRDFDAEVDKIIDNFKKAGTDPCAVAAAQEFEPPETANPTQVKKLVEAYTVLLRSMAGALPATAGGSADALKSGADSVEKAARDTDLSRDFFSSDGLLKVINSPEMSKAMEDFVNATQGCDPS